MRKRLVGFVLASSIALSLFPVGAFATEVPTVPEQTAVENQQQDNVIWSVEPYAGAGYEVIYAPLGENEAIVQGHTGTPDSVKGDLVLLDQINGKTVTEIKYEAFSGCENLSSVVLPSELKELGHYAFGMCTGLKGTVTIPASMVQYDNTNHGGAFADCTSLTAIEVEQGNPKYLSIDGVLYSQTSSGKAHNLIQCPAGKQGALRIPDVYTIEYPAVRNCAGLTGVVCEGSRLDEANFQGCSGLVNLDLPSVSIANGGLDDCTRLKKVTIQDRVQSYNHCTEDGIVYNHDKTILIRCPEGRSGTVVIPDSVQTIWIGAFRNCKYLTDIKLPEGLKEIREGAFEGCRGWTGQLTIPAGVKKIERRAFAGCEQLSGVTFPEGLTSIGYESFAKCTGLSGELKLPDSIQSMDLRCFSYCSGLTGNLVIPKVGKLENFMGCSGLKSITISADDQYISDIDNVLDTMPNLTNVQVENGHPKFVSVDGVVYSKDMTTLEAVPQSKTGTLHIPSSVTRINADLKKCKNLDEIVIDGVSEQYETFDGMLFDKDKTTLVACPQGKQGKVRLPASLEYFYNDFGDQITTFEVAEENPYYCAVDGMLCTKGTKNDQDGNLVQTKTLKLCPPGVTGKVIISSEITDIDLWAFDKCKEIEAFQLEGLRDDYEAKNGMLYRVSEYEGEKEYQLLRCPTAKEGSVVLDNIVVSGAAFKNCKNLTDITVDFTENRLGNSGLGDASSFVGCDHLESVTIKNKQDAQVHQYTVDGVLYSKTDGGTRLLFCPAAKAGTLNLPEDFIAIGNGNDLGGLKDNRNLDDIRFSGNSKYSCVNGMLMSADQSHLIWCPPAKKGAIKIPYNVTSIGDDAFSQCDEITGLILPANRMNIDWWPTDKNTLPNLKDIYYGISDYECSLPAEITARATAHNNSMGPGPEPDLTPDVPTPAPTQKPEQTGWVKVDGGWKYRNEDGSYVIDDWLHLNNIWYYCDKDGYMLTGWQNLKTGRFYFDPWGHMAENRWEMIDGIFYYFNEWGQMGTKWQLVDGVWYWFDQEGHMATGWKEIDGNWYYFDVHGTMLKDWQYIETGWFYFNESGHMLTGWQWINGSWFYMNEWGQMAENRWEMIDGIFYYFNEWGQMATNWQYIDGQYYYFDQSGHMLTGWQWIDGNCYYFYSSGAMAANTWIGNSYVNGSGVWVA